MTDIAEEFVLLRGGAAAPVGDQLLTREIVVPGAPRCLVATDANNQRHLLVEIGEETGAKDHSSKGVTLSSRLLMLGGESVRFADLHCTISALDLVFERLVEDVIRRLARPGAGAAGAICRSTLADWRALLKSAGQAMARESVVGLAGELAVLRELAARDPIAALEAWKGPEGWTHDFATHRDELEVKSTTSVDGNFIQISNIDQLDPSESDSLHLVAVHFKQDTHGATLDDRVRELIGLGVPTDELLRKVSRAGYVFESGADAGIQLTQRSMRIWSVGEGFPGLRRSELANRLHGVSNVKYQLALDSGPKRLPEEAATHLLDDWLGRSK